MKVLCLVHNWQKLLDSKIEDVQGIYAVLFVVFSGVTDLMSS